MAVKEKYHEYRKAHRGNSQFGPWHQKADHIIAILLELDIILSIPMIFHHLGPNCTKHSSIRKTPQPSGQALGQDCHLVGGWLRIRRFVSTLQ